MSGQSFTLNDTGLFLLEKIRQRLDVDSIIDQTVTHFDVDSLTVKAAISRFMSHLEKVLV
jgi:hypothetical protein